jgi:hypothetical protein
MEPDNNVTVTELEAAPPVVTAESERTISGRVLPWDEFGRTNSGPLKFPKGSLNVPKEITRVKLLAGHSPQGVAVGHATAFEAKDDGLWMTFKIGSHAAGDDALLQASEKTVDAFSVECYGIERAGTTVTNSYLSAVALVPNPAYANARISHVMASHHEDEENQGPAGDEDSTDENQPDPANDGESSDETTEEEEENQDMPKNHLAPGTLPGDNQEPAGETAHFSLNGVIDYLTGAIAGTNNGATHAELVDITDAGMIDRAAPQWLGELWSGVTYQRRIIPLMTQKPLTSRKAVGYRWVTKPGVAKYAGNKTDIPSKAAAIEAVERESERWAGGNDLDRAFWDFKEREFLAAYWEAMAESYAYETDMDALQFLIDNATAIDGTATGVQTAISRGSLAIDNVLHSPASFAIINPADLEQVLDLSQMDAPRYLGIAGTITDPSKWTTSDAVTPGTAIVGTMAAATHYELGGSPLRVEAEHIAKGGRDAALFGYTAKMVNRPEGLVSVSFDTDATTAPTEPGA